MKKLLLLILISIILSPAISKAAVDKYTLLEPLPCIESVGNCTVGTPQTEIALNDYIGYVFKFAIALAAFLAVIMIIWGGFEYMVSEIPSVKVDAKGRITNAITGLLMVLASYLILATIDPRLVEINTSIEPIKIDLSGVNQFRSNLENDLRYLATEYRNEVKRLDDVIKEKQQRIDELNYQNSSEVGLTNEELVELEKLKQEVKNTNLEMYQKIGRGVATTQFRNIVGALQNTYTDSWFATKSEEVANDAIASLEKTKVYADKLRADGDTVGADILDKDREFYVNQLKEQRDISLNALNYWNNKEPSRREHVDMGNMLQEKLTTYQKQKGELDRTHAISGVLEGNDPEKEALYKMLLDNRIEYLKKTLGQP